jgi:hypothetical protein
MTQPLATHAGAPVATRADGGYRFVVACDEHAWPSPGSGPTGLLRLNPQAQLDAFDGLAKDGHALVLVCGANEAQAVRRASALARSRSQLRVAVVPVALGPLGQQALATVGRKLVSAALTRAAGELISWLPTASRSVLDLALVSKVAKLDLPGVALRHHVMAYLPGRRTFAIQLTPATTIARINRAGALRPDTAALSRPDFDDTFGTTLILAGPRTLPDIVLQACRSATAPAALPSTAALKEFWRDSDATEVAVVPGDVLRWAASVLPSVTVVPCTWCGEPLAADTPRCVFCGNAAR